MIKVASVFSMLVVRRSVDWRRDSPEPLETEPEPEDPAVAGLEEHADSEIARTVSRKRTDRADSTRIKCLDRLDPVIVPVIGRPVIVPVIVTFVAVSLYPTDSGVMASTGRIPLLRIIIRTNVLFVKWSRKNI